MEKRNNLKKGKSDDKKNLHKLLFKNNIISPLNTQHLNTIYINTTKPNNLKIIKKKNINKREQILYTLNNKNSYSIFRKSGLPPISSQKNLNHFNSPKNKYKPPNKYSFNIPHFEPRDKEGLIVELYQLTNDMDNQNREFENLTKDYNNLINNSLAYKIIIEKILGLDENGNYLNENNLYALKNREKSKSENNFKNIKAIDEKVEFGPGDENNSGFFKTNTKYKKNLYNISNISSIPSTSGNNSRNKNKMIMKDYFNDKENQTKINVLLNQKNELNRILIEKERALIKIKNNSKNKKFDEYLFLLDKINTELEEKLNNSKILQYEAYETELQINSYSTKLKKLTDEINSVTSKLKINKKELEYNIKDIAHLKKCKEELKEKEIKLNEDEKQNKNNLKEKKEKENKIDSLLKENQKYFEEKEKTEMQIKEIQKQEDLIKKTIDKKNLNIKKLNKENKDLERQILDYEKRRERLLEKADQPRKNRIKMKDMENEIKDLEKNIVTYKVENDEKEKNMEDNIEKNNELISNQEEEINNHPDIVKDLEEQINNLKNELKEKENNNKIKGEELTKIEEDFNSKKELAKQEWENYEKIKKEKEMKEKGEEEIKNKEIEDKLNEYIKNKEELTTEAEKLKNDNVKFKEENKNLIKLHKEKMELCKLASEKQIKLNKLLSEIKDLENKE